MHYNITGHNPGDELLKKMADAAEALMPSFSSQNISNAAMAFAKLDYRPGSLLSSIADAALSKLDSFTPQVRVCNDVRDLEGK